MPRLPLEALRRLGSSPMSARRGKKGYNRKRQREEAKEAL